MSIEEEFNYGNFAEFLKSLCKAGTKVTHKQLEEKRRQAKLSCKKGDKYRISGDSKAYWIEDYNCRIDTVATVEEDVTSVRQRKVLVTLDEIDHDKNVCVSINLNKMLGISIH